MSFFRSRKESTPELIEKMVQFAKEIGERAVTQYRINVRELGFDSKISGELKARLLGAAVPTVAHNTKYGLTDWPQAGPGARIRVRQAGPACPLKGPIMRHLAEQGPQVTSMGR